MPEALIPESVPAAPAAAPAPAAPEVPPSGSVEPPPAPEPRTFSQDDVDKIVTKRLSKAQRSWERERQQLLDRVLATPSRETPQQAPQGAAPGNSEAPDPSKFTDFNQYVQAAIAHGVQQALSERDQASSAQSAQQQAAERQRILAEGVRKQAEVGAEKYEDFEEVVGDPDLPITEVMAMVIAESELGADLAYFLGKNPQETRRIAALPPVSVARELGKIEAKLQSAPPAVPKAPPPITPAKGAAGGEKDPSRMSDAEFAAWRKKQIAARRH